MIFRQGRAGSIREIVLEVDECVHPLSNYSFMLNFFVDDKMTIDLGCQDE